ncbi:glycosyltransferase family 2 protein [Hymenobacter wooponensis]|uniref:Glycosyltransferase n=1 Tax=Hymenobacter wooponensis TaxID=1525360 RepID=A0A4Z0MMV6_9BACT|nr:glycosyltransferase family 2 protein [Hymenobacter wooponensis]TGD80577.1 glycosyltransferase [Hymenobacter wooponensis]
MKVSQNKVLGAILLIVLLSAINGVFKPLMVSSLYVMQALIVLYCLHIFIPLVIFILFYTNIRDMFYKPAAPAGPNTTEFLLLIPAHNEERLLPTLLSSIHAQNYPASLVTPVVIADNCQDTTATIARQAGVTCLERFTKPPSDKMQALMYASEKMAITSQARGRVVCVIDADCRLERNFLMELDNMFSRPEAAAAVQTYRYVNNTFASDVTVLDAAAEALRQWLLSGTRKLFGMDTFVYGLGFAVRDNIFGELMRLPEYSLAEDKDWKAYLVEREIKVDFCPAARLSYEVVDNSQAFQKQRSRWLAGHFETLKKHGFRLLGQGLLHGKFAQIDFACELLQPPRSILLFSILFFAIASFFFPQYSLLAGWTWWVLAVVFVLYGFIGLRLIRAKRHHYLLLLSGLNLMLNILKSVVAITFGKSSQTWAATRTAAKQA